MFERDVGTRRAPRCRTRLPAAMIPAAFAGPRQSEIFERRIRMRKLIVHAFLTLDGVMQAPGSPNDKSGGFTHGGWTVPFWDGAIEAWQGEATSPPFDLLLGRKTYEIFAGYWPRATDVEDAEVFNSARMYVVSRTLRRVDWENSTDGLRLLLYPIVLGRGKRLFAEATIPRAFTLVRSASSPSGVVMARYQRSGDVTLALISAYTHSSSRSYARCRTAGGR
jgi:dihydrofolate reductase